MNDITYTPVTYRSRPYVVGRIASATTGDVIHFVVDAADFDTIKHHRWYRMSKQYLATEMEIDGKRRVVYMHNMILGRFHFTGKGQTTTVDHINKNGYDNRRANLRVVPQALQNKHQRRTPSNKTVPDGSGLRPEDVPKNIWYMRAHGQHGERFAIEFKDEGIVWRSTSSKKVSLQEKLVQAKAKLADIYAAKPHLNPAEPARVAEMEGLSTSFARIVGRA